MPTLPPPPSLPSRDHSWLTQTLPMLASLASIGVLSATTGHALVALVMIGGTVVATGAQVDHHVAQRRRGLARLRREYDGTLAALAPSPDWASPSAPVEDPVCRVLVARHLVRLRAAAITVPPRDPNPQRAAPPDLRAELAPGIWLDLREAAAGGVGPHGVIVGATGSGKSELLRALVLSLALRHPPSELTLLLIDFKGGTALGDLAALPHSAGLITNLATDDQLVPRMIRSLDSELDRRQVMLRDGGSPVPLVIVIDEFSELLTSHGEVTEVLVRIGRLGRSLGIHLVLASQRLDETRLRELEAHLSWRIALRTFTEAESRTVLGRPDAAHLPHEPGWALLCTGPDEPVRFRVTPADEAFAQQALGNLVGHAPQVMPIWLPPLATSPRLADLLADRLADHIAEAQGGTRPNPRRDSPDPRRDSAAPEAGFGVPVGVIDDPTGRRPVELDADRGHVAIVGRPGSGKSELIATIEAALRAVRPSIAIIRVDPLTPVLPAIGRPGTVLLVDDWSVLRTEQPLIEDALVRAATSQPGLRIILTAHRWADVRPALRDLLETRIELRLADPLDSLLDRRLAAAVPIRQPGHGLIEGEHFVAALSSTVL